MFGAAAMSLSSVCVVSNALRLRWVKLHLSLIHILIAMGLPVLTMELAVGRASRKSAVLGYKALEKPGSKWHLHGWAAIFGCYMLMMYYTTVSGWMITYFYKFLTGEFQRCV